jgi:heme exporter protein B
MIAPFAWIVKRDLMLAVRRSADALGSLGFFVIACSLFPLGVGPEPAALRSIAPGVLWVAALLAATLSLPRLFSADHADGTLEQMLLSSEPLVVIVAGKAVAHWLVSGLPLVLLSPLLALQFGLDAQALAVLAISLLLGTPILSLVGAVAAALSLGARSSGVLVALLALPLYTPVLVFGAGAVDALGAGGGAVAHLLLLGAGLGVALALAPWASSAALRIALE